MMNQPRRILTINSGSSSIKFALYLAGAAEELVLAGQLERIGLDGGRFHCRDAAGTGLVDQPAGLPDHEAALKLLFDWFGGHLQGIRLDAVGHRVVHGGRDYTEPVRISPAVQARLRELVPLAPNHLPGEVAAIAAVARRYPAMPQVACFDTAFHRRMPPIAQHYALPRELTDAGILRYGFHGLSYEYIVEELRREGAAEGRIVVAHLGNGASMAAISGGRCVDTTMGFTPTEGLVMGTRSGDVDPGILLYLLREKGFTPERLADLLNQRSGLLGVSGTSSDMKDLLDREADDPRAAEAVTLFCQRARKYVGAFAAVLGGLDLLVFTGGIGANAPAVRERIAAGLDFLGLAVDPQRNRGGADVISPEGARVPVRVMRTNEELMIARQTNGLLASLRKE